jgi:hypothetical protein
MHMRRLLLVAVGVGALVAVVALSFNILLQWSEDISVLDAPEEQVASLTPTEINDRLNSGVLRLKSVHGSEKAVFLFTRAPMALAYNWVYIFVPSTIAAFLGGLLVSWRRAA